MFRTLARPSTFMRFPRVIWESVWPISNALSEALVIKGVISRSCVSEISGDSYSSGAFCASAIFFAFSKKSVSFSWSMVPSSAIQEGEEEGSSASKSVVFVIVPRTWETSGRSALSCSAARERSSRFLILDSKDCFPIKRGTAKLVGTAQTAPSDL